MDDTERLPGRALLGQSAMSTKEGPRPATAATGVMALGPRAGKAVLPAKVTSADILGRRLSGKSPTGRRDPGAMRAAGEGVLSTGTPEPTAVLWRRSPVQVAWAAQAPSTLSGLRPPPGVPRPSPEGHTCPLRAAMAQPPQHHAPQTRPGLGRGGQARAGGLLWTDGLTALTPLCLRRGQDQPQGPLGWTHRWKRLPARPPRPTLTRSSMLTLPSLFSSRAEAKLMSLFSGMCLICFMALMSSATLMTVSLGNTARMRHSWRPLQPHWGPVGQTCPGQPLPPELPRPVLWEHPANLDTETETTAPSRVSCVCAATQRARPLQWGRGQWVPQACLRPAQGGRG